MKTPSVELPVPTHPPMRQKQCRDGGIGALQSGFSASGHLEGKYRFLGSLVNNTNIRRRRRKKNPKTQGFFCLLLLTLVKNCVVQSGAFTLPPIMTAVAPVQPSWEQQGLRGKGAIDCGPPDTREVSYIVTTPQEMPCTSRQMQRDTERRLPVATKWHLLMFPPSVV